MCAWGFESHVGCQRKVGPRSIMAHVLGCKHSLDRTQPLIFLPSFMPPSLHGVLLYIIHTLMHNTPKMTKTPLSHVQGEFKSMYRDLLFRKNRKLLFIRFTFVICIKSFPD